MRLADLLHSTEYALIAGKDTVDCANIAFDTRQVEPGTCFFCLPGTKVDGHDFAQHAVKQGAVAVVVSKDVTVTGASIVRVNDTRKALARAAATWYGRPSLGMTAVAVTGSDGKTSTTFIAKAVLEANGLSTGLIGTIRREWPGFLEKSDMTTPDPLRLQAALRAMKDAGAKAAVMEASSHALDQDRLVGVDLDAAIFTNLTRDHLDYHGTIKAYTAAKLRLFNEILAGSGKKQRVCVINADDPVHREFALACPGRLITYGFDPNAMVRPISFHTDINGSEAVLNTPAGTVNIRTELIGRHNMYNIMGVVAAAVGLGMDRVKTEQGIAGLNAIPGRLQRVNTNGPACFVDYAHTPAALENIIKVLKPMTKGRLIVVFGAGGDRDKGKRPLMGRAACQADRIVLTSDNPRTEDPFEILKQIEAGIKQVPNHPDYEVIEDRKAAICRALKIADKGDTILVAGKGHEDYQIRGTQILDFDDVKTIQECVDNAT